MNLSQFFQIFRSLVQAAFANRNNANKWEGWVDIHGAEDKPRTVQLAGKFKSVSIEASALSFVIDVEGKECTISAVPALHKAHVSINGVYEPEASIVGPTLKSTASHPLRTAVDIRPVTFNGDECRFNLRFTG